MDQFRNVAGANGGPVRFQSRRFDDAPITSAPAVRYRQLALAELDKAKAAVLYKIAEEAERDVLYSR
jgi:hypothetical protein